jgi:hypothetical protein
MNLPKPTKRVRERKQIRRSPPPRRSRRPRKQRKTSRAAMGRQADKLFSLIVRAGGCHEANVNPAHECVGGLQCAHIISRSYRSTRWDEENAMGLCAGRHVYYTHRPCEFEDFVAEFWHIARPTLRRRALVKWDGDIEGVLVRLAARAVTLNLSPAK